MHIYIHVYIYTQTHTHTHTHTHTQVGLLTLFEHYGSMQVGERLKRPRTAIWVVTLNPKP